MKIPLLCRNLFSFFFLSFITCYARVPVAPPLDGITSIGDNAFVFDGTVSERLQSPMIWSGRALVRQGVRYGVHSTLNGVGLWEITVFHLLVKGSPLCEAKEPILSKRLFAVGNHLRVYAERGINGDWLATKVQRIK